jgi:hypothetical protein
LRYVYILRLYLLDSKKIIDQFIEERRVDSSTAVFLREMGKELKDLIAEYISELLPSSNAFRGILTLVNEISHRERVDRYSILNDHNIKSLLFQEEVPRKEKIKKVREYLERKRYPERSRLEDSIHGLMKKIRKDYNLKITLPDELEGDSIGVAISGRSPDDFRAFGEKILRLSDSSELSALFSILKGEQ